MINADSTELQSFTSKNDQKNDLPQLNHLANNLLMLLQEHMDQNSKTILEKYFLFLSDLSLQFLYQGFLNTSPEEKSKYLSTTANWLKENVTQTDIQLWNSLFLEQYPWNKLYSPEWFKVSSIIKSLTTMDKMNSKNALAWLKAYFSVTVVVEMNTELWKSICSTWVNFFGLIASFLYLLPPAPLKPISYSLDSSYLNMVNYLLEFNKNHIEEQILLINDLPSEDELENNQMTLANHKGLLSRKIIINQSITTSSVALETQLNEINNLVDLEQFIASSLLLVSQVKQNCFKIIYDFFNSLSNDTKYFQNVAEKRLVASIIIPGLKSTDESWKDLNSWLILAGRIKREYGIEILKRLVDISFQQPNEPIKHICQCSQFFLELVKFFDDALKNNKQKVSHFLSKFSPIFKEGIFSDSAQAQRENKTFKQSSKPADPKSDNPTTIYSSTSKGHLLKVTNIYQSSESQLSSDGIMFRTHDEKTMRSSEVNFKVSIQDKGHFESLQRKIINIKGEDKLIILTRAADIVQLVIYNPKNNSIEDSKAFNGYWTSAPYNEEGSYKSISIASASINQEDCLIFVALYRDSATDTTLKSCVCWYNYASKNFGWSAANINDNLAYILNDPVYYHNILLSVKSSSEKNKILMTIPQNDGIHIYELDLNTKPFSWNHSSSYLPPIESLLSVQTTYTLKDHYSSLQIDKSDDLEIILFASRLKSQLVIYLYNIKKNAWDSVPNYSLNPKWSNEPVLNAKEYSQNLRLTRIKDDPDNKFLISLQGPRTVDFILYFPFINFCTTLYSLDTSAIHQHYDPANLIDAYKNGKYIKILHGHDLSDTWLEETLTVKDLNIYKFFSSSISILKHSKNLHDLYEKLKYLHQYDLELRFPEKNLESLIQDFINQSDLLKFPLSKAEVDKIALDYNAILSFSNEYKGLSIETLGHQAKILGKNLAHNPENSLRLLSLIRLAIRLNFGILPYNTQIFSVLAILNVPDKYKGRIAQVRTGEGKSTLTTILTTFLACQGRIVDVITSNSYLAKRDHLKYQNFYHYFGISSSYINHEDFKPQDFDAQVLFGTNVDFEFSLLFDAIYNKNLRYTTINSEKNKRPFDVVIVDEVDNLFIDTALNSARIANPSSKDYSWAYYPLWQLFLENPLLFSNVPPQILKAYLASYQNGKFSNQVEEFSEQQLKDWQDSARNAYRYTLDKDYVLINSEEDPNKKEIVIVDPDNTGRLMRGSRWSNGLHEFVEVKHGLFPEVESNTVAALSHPAFFNLYKNVYGLTGTMGEDIERSEIAEIYNVSSFDVPSHKSCLRKPINSKLLENDNLQAESLIQSIKFEQSKGRPVLVICSTIDDSCRISNILNNSSIKHLLLNEKQQEDEEYIIAKAGESKQVTIATNMAGRGTDIILSSESRDAGGLHVIFTFYPKNIRVQEQGYGRAGRQGQPGTCQMILCMNDPFITRLVRNNKLLDLHKEEDFLETLHSCRSKMVLEDSERRKTASKQETAIYKIALERFFIGLENIRIRLLEMDCEKLKAVLLNKPTIETNTKSFLESDHPKMKEVKSLLTNMLYRLDDLHESELRNIQNYYIELLLDRWAIWFDEQTHHRYRNLSLDEYLKHIQYEFNQLLSDGLDFAIQNPIKSFTSWLQRTIHAQEKNDSDTETSSHFAKMGP